VAAAVAGFIPIKEPHFVHAERKAAGEWQQNMKRTERGPKGLRIEWDDVSINLSFSVGGQSHNLIKIVTL
jgi:hypothetical protein